MSVATQDAPVRSRQAGSTQRTPSPAPATPSTRGRKRPKTPSAPAHGAFLERREADASPTRPAAPSARKKAAAASFATPRRTSHRSAHLASPPASPADAAFALTTPRKTESAAHDKSLAHLNTQLDVQQSSSSSLISPMDHAVAMMPTPAKTPAKRRETPKTSRMLNFNPESPNDIMPKARRIKASTQTESNGFELFDEEMGGTERAGIEIFTDTNARVPELDDCDENPFLGPPKLATSPRRRSSRIQKNAEQLAEEADMDEAAARGEGMVFTFRGKKVFRAFDNVDQHSTTLDNSLEQRTLRRSAGITSDRPFTRSQIQPRLLFPPAPDNRHMQLQQLQHDHADSEADTDIESEAHEYEAAPTHLKTPAKSRAAPTTPPTTVRQSGKRAARHALTPIDEDHSLSDAHSSSELGSSPRRGKKNSPFDAWQRTKAHAPSTSGSAKRSADLMSSSPAAASSSKRRSVERQFVTP